MYYGAGLGVNLISQGTLQDEGYLIETDARHTTVFTIDTLGQPRVLFVTRRERGDLPRVMLDSSRLSSRPSAMSISSAPTKRQCTPQVLLIGKVKDTLDGWHERVGHANFQLVRLAAKHSNNMDIINDHHVECFDCGRGKIRAANVPQQSTSPDAVRDSIVSSDLMGPITPDGYHKHKYIVTFLFRRYAFAYPIKRKNEAGPLFEQVYRLIKRQFRVVASDIKILRTDGGGEYVEADAFCKAKGIVRQKTNPSKSASNNPEVERYNLTSMNMTRTCLLASGLPKKLWSYAHKNTIYILNRLPVKRYGNKSALEHNTGTVPDMQFLRAFGTACIYRVLDRPKTDAKGADGAYLCMAEDHKGYLIYDMATTRIITTGDVLFYHRRAVDPRHADEEDFSVPGFEFGRR